MNNFIYNKDGQPISLQISTLNNVPAGNINFEKGVLIKNITEENISINVKLIGQKDFITTILYPGWNVELIKEIESVTENTLQYGW